MLWRVVLEVSALSPVLELVAQELELEPAVSVPLVDLVLWEVVQVAQEVQEVSLPFSQVLPSVNLISSSLV